MALFLDVCGPCKFEYCVFVQHAKDWSCYRSALSIPPCRGPPEVEACEVVCCQTNGRMSGQSVICDFRFHWTTLLSWRAPWVPRAPREPANPAGTLEGSVPSSFPVSRRFRMPSKQVFWSYLTWRCALNERRQS